MAQGRLGVALIAAADTETTVYTVPASTVATVNINCVNKGGTAVNVSIGIAASSTLLASEFIEYSVVLPAYGVLERTGVACSSGERVVVSASAADTVSVRVHGFEQVIA